MSLRIGRRAALAGALALPAIVRAQPGTPIRVGEINSYASMPDVAGPYRNGWRLALRMLNDLGGIQGRLMEFVSRDDGGSPDAAARLARELAGDGKVDLLAGGASTAAGLAIAAVAAQAGTPFVAGLPLGDALTWAQGNRFTYRIRPSVYEHAAILAEEAAKLPAKRWVSVAPDDEDGRSAVRWFRQLLLAKRPDVAFVAEQWPAPGRLDAASVMAALLQPAPDGVFNALTGGDLLALVRQGRTRGLSDNRAVVSMLTGEPENLVPLGADTPVGWIVTGYPWSVLDAPDSRQFVVDYSDAYGETPTVSAVVGFAMVNAIASGIGKAGGTGKDAMADGFADATFRSPFGLCRLRPSDHQSTLGTFVGRLAYAGNRGGMVDWRFVDGAAVLPDAVAVRGLRPGNG